MKHLKPSSYALGTETWVIVSKELVTERVYVPPSIDPDTGNYLDWGSYENKPVWKETMSQPFVF